MASLSYNPTTGRAVVQFPGAGRKRKSIRLGRTTRKQAESARGYIEDLIACRVGGTAPRPATVEWLAGLPGVIRRRLERVGLVEPQARRECPTLAEWVRAYIESRTDVKAGTKLNLQQTEKSLVACFGAGKRLADFTVADAEDFGRFLRVHLAEATARRRCKRARQFFQAAVKRRLLDANPFAAMPCGDFANAARFRFVTRDEIEAVLARCPDAEWRAIVALARYGGLRCPSEVLALKWEDVDFARGRFVVRSAKTEHAGRGVRTVPLFPALARILHEAFDVAEPGAEFIITRYRQPEKNLRTQLRRIIKRAGLEAWPRTFANLRASAEADLADKWPLHVCAQWLGHSPRVALTNYLRARESDYQEAAEGAAKSGAKAVQPGAEGALQKAVQSGAETGRSEPHGAPETEAKPADSLESTGFDMSMVTLTGLEPVS